jgi:hypothetical protein
MGGLIFADEDHCDDQALRDWLSLTLSFVSTLPPN